MNGNDVDQASLLIAMLRYKGYLAMYVHGDIILEPEKTMSLTGAAMAEIAADVLASGGVHVTKLKSDGKNVSIRMEHVWVRTLVPYGNYRGAGEGAGEPVWIDLDTGIKEYEAVRSIYDTVDKELQGKFIGIKRGDWLIKNGKYVLRSTDKTDVMNGFIECEPFYFRNIGEAVVCYKYVGQDELESCYIVRTLAKYRGYTFEVISERENEIEIVTMTGNYKDWESLNMKCIDKGVYQKWINRNEAEIYLKKEELHMKKLNDMLTDIQSIYSNYLNRNRGVEYVFARLWEDFYDDTPDVEIIIYNLLIAKENVEKGVVTNNNLTCINKAINYYEENKEKVRVFLSEKDSISIDKICNDLKIIICSDRYK